MVLTRGDSRSAVMVLQQTLNCWQRCLMNSFCWSRVDAFSRTGLIGAACLMSTRIMTRFGSPVSRALTAA
ncbi:hypothetical protein SM0020_28480 [Sinorhizobium meliloti CCNWSX0020]|uniref:Uncharacterized protein n=1 Tax=Sinorhizobium meliloti CCNWSX0020 TaxID=1107881 RepID=H0G859_RHIML|nr:hypothetical protein SM0020_28480 [Sinorhizobium meliloti CCNWSX0020]